jgi:hypothetical protein
MVRLGFNLARVSKKTGKERERRLHGGFIVGADLLERVGLGEGGVDRAAQRKREMLTCGPHMLARGEMGSDTLSGFTCWVVGQIWEWAEWLPSALFSFLISFRFFFF